MNIGQGKELVQSFGRTVLWAFLFLLGANLVACDSGLSGQVEKCVQAGISANGPYKSSTEKAEQESISRIFCLRAASGKD